MGKQSALADDATTTDTNSAAASTTSNKSTAALEGNIQAEDIAIITGLKELGDVCHHMKSASTDLLYESQRPNTVAIGGPTIIGNTVIPIAAAPGGIVNMGGYLPPRKKWIDYFVSQVSFLVPQLETQINSTNPTSGTANPIIADMKNEFATMKPWYERLLADTKGPPYNNYNITKDASALNITAGHIEKDQKKLERLAKKDEKSAEKQIKQDKL